MHKSNDFVYSSKLEGNSSNLEDFHAKFSTYFWDGAFFQSDSKLFFLQKYEVIFVIDENVVPVFLIMAYLKHTFVYTL